MSESIAPITEQQQMDMLASPASLKESTDQLFAEVRALRWDMRVLSRLTIGDGIRLGIGMFIVLPILLLIVGVIVAVVAALVGSSLIPQR